MTLLDRIGSTATAGATFAANFWPWLLASFLLGAGVAGWGGFTVAKWIYQGEALKAQLQLSNFQKSMAESMAMGEAKASARQTEAWNAFHARDNQINAAMANIPAQVAAIMNPKIAALRETLNGPEFDCMRLPFPPPALRLLERPGGSAAADRGDPGPSGPAGALQGKAAPGAP